MLCADIGTSSLKAALVSKDGTVAAFSQQQFDSKDSCKIAASWLPALERAANQFSKTSPNIIAICISGNGPTMVSEDGTTLLWNEAIPPEIAQTPTKSLFIPRIAGFKALFKDEWKLSRFIFSGPEYLLYQLTGKAVSILPEKRYEAAYWNEVELAKFGISENEAKKLPPFCNPAFLLGNTTKRITGQIKLSNPVPVFCGVPDFIAALIGTNTLKPGKICNRSGSSEGLNVCTEKPLTGEKIRTLPSIIPNLWNASVLIPSSGKLFSDYKADFEKETKKSVSYNKLVEYCMKNKSTQGYKIMQSLAENISSGIKTLEAAAERNGFEIEKQIAITGGQAKTPEWIQMKADFTNRTFIELSIPDAELLGDAVLAYVGLGTYKSIQEASDFIVKKQKYFYPRDTRIYENI